MPAMRKYVPLVFGEAGRRHHVNIVGLGRQALDMYRSRTVPAFLCIGPTELVPR